MRIRPLLGWESSDPTYLQYVKIIQEVLEAFVPAFFEEENIKERLKKDIPFLLVREKRGCENNISFLLISKSRPDAFMYYFEMLYRWLIPGELLDVVMTHAVDFDLPGVDTSIYTLSEIVVRLKNQEQHQKILNNLPFLEQEIKRGIVSRREAAKILEAKGYKQDKKTAVLQERLDKRIDRFPSLYGPDLLREMQHTLLLAPEGFKKLRAVDHLLRLILCQYRFRKDLLKHIESTPYKRRVFLKLIRFPFHGKDRVGICVGMNFLEDKELFEEKQLIKALNHHFPFIRPSEGASIYIRRGKELLTTVYTEIEHINGRRFSEMELLELEKELPQDLLSHVEYIMHPVFMPRNEEEVMRNILTLSKEINSIEDLPQGFISFDRQTRTDIFFTVILVRVKTAHSKDVESLFINHLGAFQYLPDRSKLMGQLTDSHDKEASVFRLKLSKEHFLRLDQSIDLYRARQFLVNEITEVIGEFRDFNGGMIAKKEELLGQVRHRLKEKKVKYNQVWLENFFYSLNPVVMQTLLDPDTFVQAFLKLSKELKTGLPLEEAYQFASHLENEYAIVIFMAHERHCIEDFEEALKPYRSHQKELILGELPWGDVIASVAIYRSKESRKQKQFIDEMSLFFSSMKQLPVSHH